MLPPLTARIAPVIRGVCLLLLTVAALGHDLYLRPASFVASPGETIRVEYHNGDAFPSSQSPVVLDRLRDAKRTAAEGDAPFAVVQNQPKMTVATATAPSKGHFWLVSRTIPNFIQLDPAKFEEYLSHEGLGRISEWRKQHGEAALPGREMYSKYVKSLLVAGAGDGFYTKPAGLTIEFIPLDDPYAARRNGFIRVQLLFRGKPAAGHEVELQWAVSGKPERSILGNTDANGIVRVPVKPGALHKLHAIIVERREDRKTADWDSYWATLTFGTR